MIHPERHPDALVKQIAAGAALAFGLSFVAFIRSACPGFGFGLLSRKEPPGWELARCYVSVIWSRAARSARVASVAWRRRHLLYPTGSLLSAALHSRPKRRVEADGARALRSLARSSLGAAPQPPCGVRGDAAEPPGPGPARDAGTRGRSRDHPRWGCGRRAPGPPTGRGGSGMARARAAIQGGWGARALPSPPELASCGVEKTSRPRRPPLAEQRPLQELDATDSARRDLLSPPEHRTRWDLLFGLTLTPRSLMLSPAGPRRRRVDAQPAGSARATPAGSTEPAGAVHLWKITHLPVVPG